MQAIVLRKAVGCKESDRKAWERAGVLIPRVNGGGAGVHADYDDANLISAAIAHHMKHAAITVSHYAPTFASLHVWLRAHSVIEWHRHRVVLTPDELHIQRSDTPIDETIHGFTVDLMPLCERLFADLASDGQQIPLPLGLGTAA